MTNRDRFAAAMKALVFRYPRARMSKQVFGDTVSAFWDRCSRLDIDAVLDAIDNAAENFPKGIPSLGELLSSMRGTRPGDHDAQRRRREEAEARDKQAANDAREWIPRGAAEQARYVATAKTEAERLARQWEVEDLNRGDDPFGDTPLEVGLPRFKQLEALFNGMFARSEELKGMVTR